VRRALRLGALAAPNGKEPATGVAGASGKPTAVDLEALVAGLTYAVSDPWPFTTGE